MEHLLRLVSIFCLFLGLEVNAGERECLIQEREKILNCRELKLTEVPKNKGKEFEHLYLDHNPLKSLTKDSFTSYEQVKLLTLENCSLEYIDNETFKPLTNLTLLYLADNLLSFNKGMSANVFEHSINLMILDMKQNPLGTIPNNAFTALAELQSLDLSETKGGLKLNSRSFNGLGNMVKLALRNNSLVTLPFEMRDDFDWKTLDLHLDDNGIHCDCKVRWLNEIKPQPKFISGKCASPSNMKGTDLYTGKPEQYSCWESTDMSSLEEASTIQCHQFSDVDGEIEAMKRQLSTELGNPKSIGKGWHCFGDTDNKELLLEVSETLKWRT